MDQLIGAGWILLLALSVLYAARQLKALQQIHRDNHDWNRRKAAQDATLSLFEGWGQQELLNTELDYIRRRDAIPITEIDEKCKTNPELLRAIHNCLNFYEALARGVLQQVFDSDIIKGTSRGVMKQNLHNFGPYIQRRRDTGSERAWIDTEQLLKIWQQEDDARKTSRQPTATV